MTHIEIIKTSLGYKQITSSGHANSGDYGEDIVCASISALMFTLANSLEEVAGLSSDNYRVEIKDGYMDIVVMDDFLSKDLDIVFKTIVVGLFGISKEYPAHVKFQMKEV